jgi:transcription-repair coupling factor (superfamily II helicase)
MLKEAIDEFEGNNQFEPVEIKVDLPVDAYIPASYIAEESLRIEAYKKIVLIKEASDVEQISAGLDDRFGKIPVQVERLLGIANLRQKARTLNITEIVYQNKKVKIAPMQLSRQQALVLVKSYKNVVIRQERKYLLVDGVAIDKTVAFLNLMFDDIISAPRSEVVGSQKER